MLNVPRNSMMHRRLYVSFVETAFLFPYEWLACGMMLWYCVNIFITATEWKSDNCQAHGPLGLCFIWKSQQHNTLAKCQSVPASCKARASISRLRARPAFVSPTDPASSILWLISTSQESEWGDAYAFAAAQANWRSLLNQTGNEQEQKRRGSHNTASCLLIL